MTNRRFAATSRSAAFSSPRCTRRASRRSSAGALISGSFWMSCRYWSNAPEGVVRKNGFALPPFDLAIGRDSPLRFFYGDGWVRSRQLGRRCNRANIGFTAKGCKSRQFSTSQIIRLEVIPAFVHYPHDLWKRYSEGKTLQACGEVDQMWGSCWNTTT